MVAYAAGARWFLGTILRVVSKTGQKSVVRVSNRAKVAHTKLLFSRHRDIALKKIGLNYNQLNPIARRFIDETHEVVTRAVTEFAMDVVQSEWEGLSPEQRFQVYREYLFRACANAVWTRVKSNAFDIGFDLGAGGPELRSRYSDRSDPVLDFMNDYEWLKVVTLSFMDSALEELDGHA